MIDMIDTKDLQQTYVAIDAYLHLAYLTRLMDYLTT